MKIGCSRDVTLLPNGDFVLCIQTVLTEELIHGQIYYYDVLAIKVLVGLTCHITIDPVSYVTHQKLQMNFITY